MQSRWIVETVLAVAAMMVGEILWAESGSSTYHQLGPPEIEVIIVTGDPLPGQDDEAERFGPPAMAGEGQLAFSHWASLATLQAIYHHESGVIGPVGIRDDSTIGDEYRIAGGSFGSGDGEVTVNPNGKMVFNTTIRPIDDSGSDDALVAGSPDGELALVVKDGDPSPDGNGVIGNSKLRPGVINQAGQIAFSNRMVDTEEGSDDDEAIFFSDGTEAPLEIVMRKGDPVPGSTEFTFGDPSTPVINDSGDVAFLTHFQQVDSAPSGVFAWDGAAIQTISMTGDPWPDCDSQGLGRHFRFDYNNAGQMLFATTCHDFTNSATTPRLVLLHDGNNLEQIAISGDPIPGLTDKTYRSFWRVRLNNAGDAVFKYRYTNGSGIGLHDGTLKNIASSDMPAPGGGTFRSANQAFSNININDRGQVVFSASVDDVDGERRSGVFFYDGNGNVYQILRHDDALLRSTIKSFRIREGWPTSFQTLDDEGWVGISFRLEDDRRGILVADGNLAGNRLFRDRFQEH